MSIVPSSLIIQNLALDRGLDTGLVILLFTMQCLHCIESTNLLVSDRVNKRKITIHYQSLCFPKIIISLDKNKEMVLLGCTEKSSQIDPPHSPLFGRGISGLVRLKVSKSSMRSFNLEVGGFILSENEFEVPKQFQNTPPTPNRTETSGDTCKWVNWDFWQHFSHTSSKFSTQSLQHHVHED